MSDAALRGRSAKFELELTAEAFEKLRTEALERAAKSRTPDEAWIAICEARAIDGLKAKLSGIVSNATLVDFNTKRREELKI